jgi:hypothetical protein
MDTIIWFRDWTAADITAPQSGDAVFLLGLNYSPPIEGGLRLSVFGIAFGANAVDVTISSGTDSATATVQTATEGQFEANLTLDANAAGSTGIVVAVNAGQNASGTDRAAFVFPDVGLIELAPHRQQDVEPARLAYGAGTPDRLLYARTFVRLSHSLPWGKWADKTIFAMRDGKFGSEQESDGSRILGRFLEDDEFGSDRRHALHFEEQVPEILVAASATQ